MTPKWRVTMMDGTVQEWETAPYMIEVHSDTLWITGSRDGVVFPIEEVAHVSLRNPAAPAEPDWKAVDVEFRVFVANEMPKMIDREDVILAFDECIAKHTPKAGAGEDEYEGEPIKRGGDHDKF